jgi:hypothetical protein
MKKFFLLGGLLLVACEVEDIGVGENSITVRNEDSAPVEVLIADSTTCFAGTHSTIQPKTTRLFDVSEEAYVCMNGGGTKATPNAVYVIEGGAITME